MKNYPVLVIALVMVLAACKDVPTPSQTFSAPPDTVPPAHAQTLKSYHDFDLIEWVPMEVEGDTGFARWEAVWQGEEIKRVIYWPLKNKEHGIELWQDGNRILYAGHPHRTEYPDHLIFPCKEDGYLYLYETCFRSRTIWMRMTRSLEPQYLLVFHDDFEAVMTANAQRIISKDGQWLAVEQPVPHYSGTVEEVKDLEEIRPLFAKAMRSIVPGDTTVPVVTMEGDPLLQHTSCLFGREHHNSGRYVTY
jgi:hypothetical protein